MAIKTCNSCAAYAALANECRAKPPTAVVIEGPKGAVPAGIFPLVRGESWCGEWRPDPNKLDS